MYLVSLRRLSLKLLVGGPLTEGEIGQYSSSSSSCFVPVWVSEVVSATRSVWPTRGEGGS